METGLPGERESIIRALSRLRPIERNVLLMNCVDGLDCREIATRLGISAVAVERCLADALYQLDLELERQVRRWWKWW